jgi:hypothetical protein
MKPHTLLVVSILLGASLLSAMGNLSTGPEIQYRNPSEQEKFSTQTAEAIQADPDQACEITKSAVKTADIKTITLIVEKTAELVPEKIQLVAQCAIAQAPDAAESVLHTLDRILGKNASASIVDSSKNGIDSAKSGKDGDVASATSLNPLDFPIGPNGATNTVGPPAGAAGGFPMLPPGGQPGGSIIIINPPAVTNVDP